MTELTRRERKALLMENQRWPVKLTQIPRARWPVEPDKAIEVWRSRDFLVTIYREADGVERLSVNRTKLNGDDYADGISWDELQRLKRECGRGDREGVELYPADEDEVNVSNMRHLWVMPAKLPFGWKVGQRA